MKATVIFRSVMGYTYLLARIFYEVLQEEGLDVRVMPFIACIINGTGLVNK